MFEIVKAKRNNDLEQKIISLSKSWENEKCCYGYVANSSDTFKGKDIFIVCLDEKQIIGYLLCHEYIKEEDSCTVKKGSKCLEIDEIYVLPNYRSQGLGQKLFNNAIESYNGLEYVTLSTATKNYKAILHFYIEELDMTFWCASLFKKLNKKP